MVFSASNFVNSCFPTSTWSARAALSHRLEHNVKSCSERAAPQTKRHAPSTALAGTAGSARPWGRRAPLGRNAHHRARVPRGPYREAPDTRRLPTSDARSPGPGRRACWRHRPFSKVRRRRRTGGSGASGWPELAPQLQDVQSQLPAATSRVGSDPIGEIPSSDFAVLGALCQL